jgi:hypothetical protein
MNIIRTVIPPARQAKLFIRNNGTLLGKHLYNKNNKNVQLITLLNRNTQVRNVQSEKMRESPGFLDSLVGTYEDPEYPLDMKAEEWRDGQYKHYLSWAPINEYGIFLIGIPAVAVMVMSGVFLMWYTFFDIQTSVMRDNPHPWFEIKHGKDLWERRNPLYIWMYPFGPHQDFKVSFYFEIEDAINRKKLLEK